MSWKLKAGYTSNNHPTITESTTEIVACGDSWCDGRCGLPALVLQAPMGEFRAFGVMVACGPVFQPFRSPWKGAKVEVTLTDDLSIDKALKRYWI